MTNIKSYLKDSQSVLDLLKLIEVDDDLILCTSDVSSLYTCIPHKLGIEAIKENLDKDDSIHLEQKEFIVECINFCLTKNYFWFNKQTRPQFRKFIYAKVGG